MKKFAALALTTIALASCAANTEQINLTLGSVPGISDYRAEVEEHAPSLLPELDKVLSAPINGRVGTTYQTVGQTDGLENWLATYSTYSETPHDFERNWLACYVDYDFPETDSCQTDILDHYGMN